MKFLKIIEINIENEYPLENLIKVDKLKLFLLILCL